MGRGGDRAPPAVAGPAAVARGAGVPGLWPGPGLGRARAQGVPVITAATVLPGEKAPSSASVVSPYSSLAT